MRLLVCGGRDFCDVPRLWALLDGINARRIAEHGDGIRCLIDGGQVKILSDGRKVGADHWAHQWALATGTDTERHFADWDAFGKSAGPRRNRSMFDDGKPTHGLAMPGGTGTADMIAVMRAGGIPVWQIEP